MRAFLAYDSSINMLRSDNTDFTDFEIDAQAHVH
jgi:hypothetical protein